MKKNIAVLCLSFLIHLGFAQDRFPKLSIEGDSTFLLDLAKLDVTVSIFENTAMTTLDIHFYNPLDRILEGQLDIPLNEGQVVSRFAMEVNGKLREGVIVEKQQGRKAFERIVRQEIDPGLLEMTEGNNFRTRIYPIPAKGYKRVLIAYEEDLDKKAGAYHYALNLAFEQAIAAFKIKAKVTNALSPMILDPKSFPDMTFTKTEDGFEADFDQKHYLANQPLKIKIPVAQTNQQLYLQKLGQETYFYLRLPNDFPMLQEQEKRPATIEVYWDVSLSAQQRDLQKEQILLFEYLKYLGNGQVAIHPFSNDLQERSVFQIKNGNLRAVEKYLSKLVYDGGTQLGCLNLPKQRADLYLLFTDGLSNWGDRSFLQPQQIVHCINSALQADHSRLHYIAAQTGGQYFNLSKQSIDDALADLKSPPLQFLGAKHHSKISELYPKVTQVLGDELILTGKLNGKKGKLKLEFGQADQVLMAKTIKINSSNISQASVDLQSLWAKQKLRHLLYDRSQHEAAITALGKRYKLVTPYTSLIVLDRLQDYIDYGIEPPEEFMAEYTAALKNQKRSKTEEQEMLQEALTDHQEELMGYWENFEDWYTGRVASTLPATRDTTRVVNESTGNNNSESIAYFDPVDMKRVDEVLLARKSSRDSIDPSKGRFIGGVVKDEYNDAVPFANVIIKGTSFGVSTDIDGIYEIWVPDGYTELEARYTGYSNQAVTVGASNRIDITLSESALLLSEVVVTGYGVEAKQSLTAPLQKMLSGVSRSSSLDNDLSKFQQSFRESSVRRGFGAEEPLYVIDGLPYDRVDMPVLSPEDIIHVSVLKNEEAIVWYGSRAKHGVVMIKTKDGPETPEIDDDSLGEKMVEFAQTSTFGDSIASVHTDQWYTKYLELRTSYEQIPFFYIDVVDFFRSKGKDTEALKILSNLAEIKLEDYQLQRALGHYLFSMNANDLAIQVFEQVLELRPDEPQSYRDLALVYEAKGNPQKAIDLLYSCITKSFIKEEQDLYDIEERFDGFEEVVLVDMNGMISRYGKALDLSNIDKKFIRKVEMDLRIVLNWNTSETDLDLWVSEPSGSLVKYDNTKGDSGGYLSEDMMDAYGPESYCLKEAPAGDYAIYVDLYNDRQQVVSGGTLIQVYIYTNFGRKDQKMESLTLRVAEQDVDNLKVGTFTVKK